MNDTSMLITGIGVISAAGNNVTDAFRYYCRPLLGSGLHSAHRLRAPKVSKILAKSE